VNLGDPEQSRCTHVKPEMISHQRKLKTGNMTTTTQHVRCHLWLRYSVWWRS